MSLLSVKTEFLMSTFWAALGPADTAQYLRTERYKQTFRAPTLLQRLVPLPWS
jgi:hypothetical protein